jgi:coenzyme PQQ biosynthesis protein C
MEYSVIENGLDNELLSAEELRARIRNVGEERYHHRHPFHIMMHEGRLSRGQLQAWALNRFYYQSRIPIKDAIILSRSDDVSFRLAWRKRIIDHDGDATGAGGIDRWLKLAEATGLDPAEVTREDAVLPATRYAVNEYLRLVEKRTLLEAVASSLTEMFSRELIALRIERLHKYYPWLSSGLDYFQARLSQAPEDARFAFDYVYEHAATRPLQESALRALRDKCDILWAQLDALYFAYVQPCWPPRGVFSLPESAHGPAD